jgi:hypothetical protein
MAETRRNEGVRAGRNVIGVWGVYVVLFVAAEHEADKKQEEKRKESGHERRSDMSFRKTVLMSHDERGRVKL